MTCRRWAGVRGCKDAMICRRWAGVRGCKDAMTCRNLPGACVCQGALPGYCRETPLHPLTWDNLQRGSVRCQGSRGGAVPAAVLRPCRSPPPQPYSSPAAALQFPRRSLTVPPPQPYSSPAAASTAATRLPSVSRASHRLMSSYRGRSSCSMGHTWRMAR